MNPAAFFYNRDVAKRAAAAVNDATGRMCCSYTASPGGGVFYVEAEGVSVEEFNRILEESGFDKLRVA